MLESLLALSLFTSLVLGFLQVSRATLAHLWLSHVLYQTLICLAEGEPQFFCQTEASRKIDHIPIGTQQLRMTFENLGPSEKKGEIHWKGYGNLQLKIQQHLRL